MNMITIINNSHEHQNCRDRTTQESINTAMNHSTSNTICQSNNRIYYNLNVNLDHILVLILTLIIKIQYRIIIIIIIIIVDLNLVRNITAIIIIIVLLKISRLKKNKIRRLFNKSKYQKLLLRFRLERFINMVNLR